LATPKGARDRARQIIAQGLTAPLDIVFGGGTYRSGIPLELRPEDSGSGAFPVTWKAAPGARVIWCAGREIPHQWSRGEAGVWQIDLSGIGPTSWNFRQLFVDGRRATRARFPAEMRLGQLVSRAAREEGLVVRALPEGDIIAFSPALTVTPAQLDDILDRLLRAVERVRAGISPAA